MPEEQGAEGFRQVLVELKSSSSKDGKEGYRILVADGCTQAVADAAADVAITLRLKVLAALAVAQ